MFLFGHPLGIFVEAAGCKAAAAATVIEKVICCDRAASLPAASLCACVRHARPAFVIFSAFTHRRHGQEKASSFVLRSKPLLLSRYIESVIKALHTPMHAMHNFIGSHTLH